MFCCSLLQSCCLVALLVTSIPGGACSAPGELGKRVQRSPSQDAEQLPESKERNHGGDANLAAPSLTDPLKDEHGFAVSIFPMLADPRQSPEERERHLEYYAQKVLLAEFSSFLGLHLLAETAPAGEPHEMNVQNLLALLEWVDLSLPDAHLTQSIRMLCARLERILHGSAALTAWKLQAHLAERLPLEHRVRLHQLAPRLFLSYARRFWLPSLDDPVEGDFFTWLGHFDQLLDEVASQHSSEEDVPTDEPILLALQIANWALDICMALNPSHQVFTSWRHLVNELGSLELLLQDAGRECVPYGQEQDPIDRQLRIALATLDRIREIYSAAQELARGLPKACWLYRVRSGGESLEELLEDSLNKVQEAEMALQAALDPEDTLAGTHYERAQRWMQHFNTYFGLPINVVRDLIAQLEGDPRGELYQLSLYLLRCSQRFLCHFLPFEVSWEVQNSCYITLESLVDFSGVFRQERIKMVPPGLSLVTISSLVDNQIIGLSAEQILGHGRRSFEAELHQIASLTAYVKARSSIIHLMGDLFTVHLGPSELAVECPHLIALGEALSELLRRCEAEEGEGKDEEDFGRDSGANSDSATDVDSDLDTGTNPDSAFGFSLDAYPAEDANREAGPDYYSNADDGDPELSVDFENDAQKQGHCREQALQWILEYDEARGNFLQALHDHLQLLHIDDPAIDAKYPSFEYLFVRFRTTKRAQSSRVS